jgi:hypothetical protein
VKANATNTIRDQCCDTCIFLIYYPASNDQDDWIKEQCAKQPAHWSVVNPSKEGLTCKEYAPRPTGETREAYEQDYREWVVKSLGLNNLKRKAKWP